MKTIYSSLILSLVVLPVFMASDIILTDAKLTAFFKLSDDEQFKRGVTTLDSGESAVVWSPLKYSDEINKTLDKAKIGFSVSAGRGHGGWYILQKDFAKARQALLANKNLQVKEIKVVTPDLKGL
jgi:hypothetical protein